MTERRVPVRTIRVTMPCPAEGCAGEMRHTGLTLTSNPPWFVHRCPVCGHEDQLRRRYPVLEYEEEKC
jgi:hypothetical protein